MRARALAFGPAFLPPDFLAPRQFCLQLVDAPFQHLDPLQRALHLLRDRVRGLPFVLRLVLGGRRCVDRLAERQ